MSNPSPLPDPSLQPETDPQPKRWMDKRWTDFDWVWNTLTVACLVLSSSFVTTTAQAFAKGGWDFLQTAGTLGQGAGLVFVTGGALTDRGRSALQQALQSLNIKPEYHAEVTCAGAVITLACSYSIYQGLPSLGDYYYRQGQKAYDEGRVALALSALQEAANFDSNDPRINIALGNFYQKAKKYELALPYYEQAALFGEPEAFNGLGRATMRLDPSLTGLEDAEVFFLIGLSQANASTDLSEVSAFLWTHLGFLYLQQAQILANLSSEQWDLAAIGLAGEADPVQALQALAADALAAAKDNMAKTDPETPGFGMSECYLAILLDQQGKTDAAQSQWQVCIDRARPASLGQFQDILDYGGPKIAQQVNTSRIITYSPVARP